MEIEFTGYERPRRLASSTHMSSMDTQGALTFDPIPGGTRMRWSWELEPRGVLKLVGPVVAWMGRRQELRIWTSLKGLLEAGDYPQSRTFAELSDRLRGGPDAPSGARRHVAGRLTEPSDPGEPYRVTLREP